MPFEELRKQWDADPDGPMLEAKANFDQFMGADGKPVRWFDGATDWSRQLQEQSDAADAAGMTVEWHIQKKVVADYIRELARDHKNVTVFWDPGP
jgi:hypothetical protein